MRAKVEFDDLKVLLSNMQKLDNSYQQLLEDTTKELAQRLIRAVRQRTQVVTGTLRREWKAGEVRKNGGVYEIEVFNDARSPKGEFYASYVEYGHRTANHQGWVKGQFMLTISERELEGKSDKWIEKRIKSWLERVFNGK